MARWIIGRDDYKPNPVKQPAPHKVQLHGKPRWGYAFKRGKGGQAVQPGMITMETRLNEARALVNALSNAKVAEFRNIAATAALKHGIAIPTIERSSKVTERAELLAMLTDLDTTEAKERNAKARKLEEAGYRLPAVKRTLSPDAPAPWKELFCGKCGNLVPDASTEDAHSKHKTECPRRLEIWRDLMCNPEFRDRQRKRKENKDALWAAIRAAQSTATNAKPSTVPDEFNASDIAMATATEKRTSYVNASAYSDQHK